MKRIPAVLCCLLFFVSCIILSGCGGSPDMSDSQYLGTWESTHAEYGGMEMSMADILGGAFTFTLEADGTASVFPPGSDELVGTWEETDNGIKLKSDGTLTLTETGNALKTVYEGITLYFERTE